MADGPTNSVVNLGELSKPADTLIKKISNAVGGLCAPWQIKRVAKAEADAALIKAESGIQVTDLQRRAMHRFVEEESKFQQNMEEITVKALPLLTDAAKPETVEDDWITNFFDKSRIVSDEDMQKLWSAILAGEANAPGSFSKKTVNLLSDMDKLDAIWFTALCGFAVKIRDPVPLIFPSGGEMYSKHGINFSTLSHLESLGLIKFDAFSGFSVWEMPKRIDIYYFRSTISLELMEEKNNKLDIGNVLLTPAGRQLAPICNSEPVPGFLDFINQRWKNFARAITQISIVKSD